MSYEIDLSGHRALVTGGGQHTGRAFARGLARAGASVIVNDVVAEKAETVAAEVRDAGGEAEAAVFDVTDLGAVQRALADRGVDIVVNNVGGIQHLVATSFANFGDSEPDGWRRMVDLNLFGTMHTTHATLPHMCEQGWGRFVTIISDAARKPERGMAAYGAAKAASAAFTRGIATEYGRQGITANVISFGTIRYDAQGEVDAEQVKKMTRPYAVKRLGEVEDPVGMVVLLSSDAASWITGQVIPVDGGYTNAL